MTHHSWLILAFTCAGFGTGGYFFYRLYSYLRIGKNENRLDQLGERIKVFLSGVIGQKKMFKDFIPGLAHALVFWGFLVITLGTLELIINGIFPSFHLSLILGETPYQGLLVIQDIFYVFVLVSILFFFFRRLVLKPKRLEVLSRHSAWDAYLILSLIGILMISGLFLSHAPSKIVSEVSWWVHFLTVLGFFCYLPFSKHLHVVAAAPNIFFSTLTPRGRLKKLNLTDETQTTFGAGELKDFTWKQLLDTYACTECGRCNEFCPTYTTGKPLKPRSLIVDLRHHLEEKGANPSLQKSMIGDIISEDVIWDCTTCGACVEACPVFIEHVEKIVDMRRNLVLMQGKMEPEAQKVFTNWENTSNPWGLAPSTRGDWAKELGIKTLAENPNVEYLYYVGCAGSFDSRSKKIAQAFAKLLLKANISFGILGAEEKCNGECARRMGNEYLGQQMIEENKKVLSKYNVKKILTTCPHCFNTLKNEYPDFDARFEVTHHVEFLMKLMEEEKIKVKKEIKQKMTYHDSCYLGRYNSIYDSPRTLLQLASGEKPIEMPRSKSQGFCCGAGGGRMWLEETRGTRINVNRVEEALATQANIIVSACPFCQTMVSDGLKTKNQEDHVSSFDIAEILESAIL
ncbi:MAG: 4Fe-4S dicluster domain-containing protein [Deltaproteobacteria bacterium]|nr:4Fe-4S dicluster domain-containing protein [Deltaproteobacteria bacterium]